MTVTGLDTEAGRRDAVAEAMASFALEGMEPSAEVLAWARDYIAGTSTLEQRLEQLQRRWPRQDEP